MGWGTGNLGGGSGGLNFKIVGGTSEPSSPRENDIWINTDVKITSWVFSATEPETPVEGMVWISTGTTSTVEFNALKKNGIQVYPLSAKQYLDGVWVDKTAKSYQGGEWVEFIVDLDIYYNNKWTLGYLFTALSNTLNGANIFNDANPPYITHGGGSGVCIKGIDTTHYKTMEAVVSWGGNQWSYVGLAIDNVWYNNSADSFVAYQNNSGAYSNKVVKIDISDLTGVYYFKFTGYTNNATTFTLHSLRLLI